MSCAYGFTMRTGKCGFPGILKRCRMTAVILRRCCSSFCIATSAHVVRGFVSACEQFVVAIVVTARTKHCLYYGTHAETLITSDRVIGFFCDDPVP